MSWSPLGVIFRNKTEQVKRVQKQLEQLIDKYDSSADQLALAWVMKHPAKVYPVVGTTTKTRLNDAIAAVEIDLELTDWYLLLEASKGHEVP